LTAELEPIAARHLQRADFVAKRFWVSQEATLIQDQPAIRKIDSKICSLRFDCCGQAAPRRLLQQYRPIKACRREMGETGATGRSSFAETGNIDEGLRPSQHRQQTQQQHLIERIDHLAELARVRQILEVIQKGDCFT